MRQAPRRDRELDRLAGVWPELSERARFALLILAGLSLLRHTKVRSGLGALGSGLRYRAGMVWRETRGQLGNAGRRLSGLLRS